MKKNCEQMQKQPEKYSIYSSALLVKFSQGSLIRRCCVELCVYIEKQDNSQYIQIFSLCFHSDKTFVRSKYNPISFGLRKYSSQLTMRRFAKYFAWNNDLASHCSSPSILVKQPNATLHQFKYSILSWINITCGLVLI